MIAPDLQPQLADSVVSLTPLTPNDWEPLYAVASDPLIWADHPASDRWRESVFRRFFADALASCGALTARDSATGVVCGSSRYDVRRAGPNEVEIGWSFLARDRWGGRTNAAMKRLMIGHALRDFERTIFLVGQSNIRSRRAMEKIGGVLTDRVEEIDVGGSLVRYVSFAIDRKGFSEGPLAHAAWPPRGPSTRIS